MSALQAAFSHPDPSARLDAALRAGMNPSLDDVDVLLQQCRLEPDFQVREMLTWALIRQPVEIVVPKLVAELTRPEPQARSQALHTLSEVKDSSAWPAVALCLDDQDQDVVRTAWYAGVALVPDRERSWLAGKLSTRLGHGDDCVRRSLSRALIALGEDVIDMDLSTAAEHADLAVRQHVQETKRFLRDPDLVFGASLKNARREVALGRTRSTKG